MQKDFTAEMQKELCTKMLNTTADAQLTDIKFVVGADVDIKPTTFNAHRFFLSKSSAVFRAMLLGVMKEREPDVVIPIPDLSASGFHPLLKYLYCCDPEISMENVLYVKIAANKYQINKLSVLCDTFLDRHLNEQNIMKLYNEAINLQLDPYVEICKKNLGILNTKIIIGSQSFINSSPKTLLSFLGVENLKLMETDLWLAVEKVVDRICEKLNYGGEPSRKKSKLMTGEGVDSTSTNKADKDQENDEKKELLSKIAGEIRFGLMPIEFFQENVKPLGFLTLEEELHIVRYMIYPASGCGKFRTDSRWPQSKHKKKDEYIVAVIGVPYIDGENGWEFDGIDPDAISFYTNQTRFIKGVGFFECYGVSKIEIAIFVGENNKENTPAYQEQQEFIFYEKGVVKPVKFVFRKPLAIYKHIKYTIQMLRHSETGNKSAYVEETQTIFIHPKTNFTVAFSSAKVSPNGTDIEQGAIAQLYFDSEEFEQETKTKSTK